MNTMPIIVMNSILFVITVLLAIADKLLVSYGECKITIEQDEEKKEFKVQGGQYLLSYLIENGIPISASCGGKASCGYCKVRLKKGGGPILPTEEIFMSREELLNGTRLACQVKVKDDSDIYIPDFLTTVRSIVENKLFDPKLKWSFYISDQKKASLPPLRTKLDSEEQQKLQKIIDNYKDKRGIVVPLLQDINAIYNYLPEHALKIVSKELNIPLSILFRIATFYNAFTLKPRGKHIITICTGTACHVKGAGEVLEAFEKRLDVKAGQTTEDGLFTLTDVRCIGCCGLAPVIKINEDVHGLVTKKDVPKLIDKYKGV